ncbi:MAG TPA: helix-turn-helix transcriptional regulator [Pseudonocardiaceae bacterium]|jgi:transcriptional regulator with XRE-family HTH domain
MTEEDRQRIAATLRQLRTDAGMTTTELAGRLGWSQSKVSKTELGRTLPTPADVTAWAQATGASDDARRDLLMRAERAAAQATEWRRELAPGRRRKQEEIRRLEATASVIRVFAMDVIPGLAQTADYAETMFRLGRQIGPEENLDGVVAERLARQQVLTDTSKRFCLLMSETALRRRLVSSAAMGAQLARLIELSTQPHIDLAVIMFDAQERTHQYHSFAILGDPATDDDTLVLAETLTRGLAIRGPEEVHDYLEHFQTLREAAISDDALRAQLQELLPAQPQAGAARSRNAPD